MRFIDLSGPEGNAFYLLSQVKIYAKQKGEDPEPIQEDTMSGDYEHLLEVFEEHFGEKVELIR